MDLQALIDARIQSALDKALDEMVTKGLSKVLGAQLEAAAATKTAEVKTPQGGEQLPLNGVPVVATMMPENGRPPRGPDIRRRTVNYPGTINVRINPHYRGSYPWETSKESLVWKTITEHLRGDTMNRSQLSKEIGILLNMKPGQVSGAISHMLRRGRLVMA